MEVLVQTACIWQAYAIGDPLPGNAFRCAIQADGTDIVSVYVAKQVLRGSASSSPPALQRTFHIFENSGRIWSRSVPPHIRSKNGGDVNANSTVNNTSILVCDTTRALPRWYKFVPKFELGTCVSFDREGSGEKFYLGRGKSIAADQTKTFNIGTFSPSDGLLVLRDENSTYVTDDFEILCVPLERNKYLAALRGGR